MYTSPLHYNIYFLKKTGNSLFFTINFMNTHTATFTAPIFNASCTLSITAQFKQLWPKRIYHLRLIIALKEGSFTRQVKMKTKWRIKRTVAMCASFNPDKYKKTFWNPRIKILIWGNNWQCYRKLFILL